MSLVDTGTLPKFLHLTDAYLGEEATLKPKIPKWPYEDEKGCVIEDAITPRVSFATSIDSALLALKDYAAYDVYYIYGTDKLNGMYVPKALREEDNAVTFLVRSGVLSSSFSFEYGCLSLIRKLGKKKYQEAFKGVVPDADVTGEIWAKKSTNVQYVGKLVFGKE